MLPGGMSYRVLVLPSVPTMTPALLRKVKELVAAGATVIGPRPQRSPSLSGYPNCDAEVKRIITVSHIGASRSSGYPVFKAKGIAEEHIRQSGVPYTIIRSTQFLEFLGAIAASSADGNIVRLSPGLFQPIAADDVAAIVADVALAAPRSGIVEIAGPERAPLNEIVARYLKAVGDPREVVCDPEARYWGGRVEERSLVPLGEARLGRIGLDDWLRRSRASVQPGG